VKILVMHQVPYRKIQYHRGIDHQVHDVAYFGTAADLAAVPADLRCTRVELAPGPDLAGRIIARTSRADGWEAVLALSEFGIAEAAMIREHLGLPGPSRERLELVRDKVAMKAALAVAGIRHPRFVAAPPACGPLPWTGRTVVKPRRGASSSGVEVFPTAREALAHYRRLEDRTEFELEEFVEGALFHADGLVDAGHLTDLVVSRYVGTPARFAKGEPVGSSQLPQDPRHREFTARALAALGVEEGCVHVEFFETAEGELVFLEAANRLGGAGIVDEYERHTGVHLPSHEMAVRLGWARPAPQPTSGRFHGFLLYPGHLHAPDTVWRVEIPDELRDHPCVDQLHRSPEPAAPGQISYQEWQVPLFLEASHPDPDTLAAFLRDCAARITVTPVRPVLEGAA
jgi:hypothetical protein